ncbi:S-adenosyl-L-methionine-dependent methyltransferase [Sphaerosporella brunnea]|uniref:type I protein arginine methyltransferase n=1 Tax=Sphaerosporella brunnea TaxID=1250544 RepID=A0A5J5EQR7_9PEZI|nr:S-adenosyl-L-methionine-dependent methyltransferase [Sphaerosporella brunnea]
MPPPRDDLSDSASEVDTDSSAGYEDAPDADLGEETQALCLLCDTTFPSAQDVFSHCASAHGFDWKSASKGLDFYSRIKLVNYIRTHKAYDAAAMDWEDEKYLKPVVEGDAMLFELEDGEEEGEVDRVKELEEQLRDLKMQFAEYKERVSERFVQQLDVSAVVEVKGEATEKPVLRDNDSHYFNSYAGNDIHELMLKDAVRTDAYRDFVYNNKNLFKDKVVLDVGCGTGVLSMFCAKAGAKKVISVDNSAIIDKARANVFENGLDGVITLLHGKIEEVTLPVEKVDVIISEWMGYCLLYEAMLDSVLYARDRYLKPDGLMVPSQTNILIAAVHDPEYMNDYVNFWDHVYGFSMTAMKKGIRDDVTIMHLSGDALASEPVAFCHLPLHDVTVQDLEFTKPFELVIKEDTDSLDAFVVYFDTFFATERHQVLEKDARAESWKDPKGGNAFTTSPGHKETHWKQGLCLVEVGKNAPLKKGEVIKGEITYRKRKENPREVEVEISWKGEGEKMSQMWAMR